MAAFHVFRAEVAKVCDRSTKRGQPQPQSNQKYFPSPCAGWRVRRGRGATGSCLRIYVRHTGFLPWVSRQQCQHCCRDTTPRRRGARRYGFVCTPEQDCSPATGRVVHEGVGVVSITARLVGRRKVWVRQSIVPVTHTGCPASRSSSVSAARQQQPCVGTEQHQDHVVPDPCVRNVQSCRPR